MQKKITWITCLLFFLSPGFELIGSAQAKPSTKPTVTINPKKSRYTRRRSRYSKRNRRYRRNRRYYSRRNSIRDLHRAVRQKKYSRVKSLIQAGVDINGYFAYGTPLSLAVRLGNLRMVKLLIENKADINRSFGPLKRTPLYTAIMYGKYDILKYLLKKGADVNQVVSSKRYLVNKTTMVEKNISPVYLAVQAYYANAKFVKLLLKYKANPNIVTSEGRHAITEAIYSYKVDEVKSLLKSGVNLEHREKLPKPRQWLTDKSLNVIEYAEAVKKLCGRPKNLKKINKILALLKKAKLSKKQ